MTTATINGVDFEVPDPSTKAGSRRGRKSPKGRHTGLPFNQFMWQLLDSNTKTRKLTDNQIVAVVFEEFKEESAIRERIEKDWGAGTNTMLSQCRSHFNHNCLVSGSRRDFPSFSLNGNGECIYPESGRPYTKIEIINKLNGLKVSLASRARFLSHYGLS